MRKIVLRTTVVVAAMAAVSTLIAYFGPPTDPYRTLSATEQTINTIGRDWLPPIRHWH